MTVSLTLAVARCRRRRRLPHVCDGNPPDATLGDAEEASARAPVEPVFPAAKSRTAAKMGFKKRYFQRFC